MTTGEALDKAMSEVHDADSGYYDDGVVDCPRAVFDRAMEIYWSSTTWKPKEKENDLLSRYSKYLEDNGYLDIDWRDEDGAVDDFLKQG